MEDETPLFEGLKVLDVGTWIAGPVAATILADYGADVIKVEMPGVGDGYRQFAHLPGLPQADVNYTWLMDARNKRSITLNLKDPRGKAILLELVADCDIYVTNHPQSMRRELGLSYPDLAALNPRLIYASLTAYGEQGPEQDREGFDLVAYWARTGLMDLVRQPDAPPNQSLPGMGDHPTALALYASIVTALLRRERTGKGSKVHTSLIANGLWAASCLAQAHLAGADFSVWRAGRGPTRALYQASDGRWMQFSMVRTRDEFSSMLEVLGLRALIGDERFATAEARIANGPIMSEQITSAIAADSSAAWLTAFHAAGVPAARVGTLDDLEDDPQLASNAIIRRPPDDIPLPWIIDHPLNVDELPTETMRPAPALGEHTDQVLGALGYGRGELDDLRRAGVI